MTFAIRDARPQDLEAIVLLAVESQADPQRFVGYLSDTTAGLTGDIGDIEDWPEWTVVALDDARRIIGWMLAEIDADMGRVWWWGPVLADVADGLRDPLCDALFGALADRTAQLSEHEFAFDSRARSLAEFARRHGFVAEEGSLDLLASNIDVPRRAVGANIEEFDAADGPTGVQVAQLHDDIFPGTHTTGRALVDQTDERLRRFVAHREGRLIGYVATVLHHDELLYIDFLGVAADVRGEGIGRALIIEAMRAQAGAHGAHLTVREGNAAARRMYASIGFVEERVLTPWRCGFSLT